MKNKYTHISVLIDRSGSMQGLKRDVIGGFNQFIEDQKKEEGELTVTLVQFDSGPVEELYQNNNNFAPGGPVFGPIFRRTANGLRYTVSNDFSDINKVELLNEYNYQPSGGTPLNDALIRLIEETGKKLAALSEDQRPEKVIVLVMTDGEENSSVSTTEEVKALIDQQTNEYNWKFVYIGANQDSFAESNSRGMGASMNFAANSIGTKSAYTAISKTMGKLRSASKIDYESFDVTGDLQTEYTAAVKEEEAK